jgi:hypothetical protein
MARDLATVDRGGLPHWAVQRVQTARLTTSPAPGRTVLDDLAIRTGLTRRVVRRCLAELRSIEAPAHCDLDTQDY